MTSRELGVAGPRDLERAISWNAKGFPAKQPHTGWYMYQPLNVTFEMELEAKVDTIVLTSYP
jgi:hypothetical protein